MKHIMTTLLIAASIVSLASCQEKVSVGGNEERTFALDSYWAETYDGPLGIQIKNDKNGNPLMYVADEPFYAAGVNCYDLFLQSLTSNDSFSFRSVDKTFHVLSEEKVPVVRFSCIPWHKNNYGSYFNHKEQYLHFLDKVATKADELHIGLIPSIIWNHSMTSAYFNEKSVEFGNPQSETHKFMLSFTEELVNLLKGHKCILAWEWGNEFNLSADIGMVPEHQDTSVPAPKIAVAYKAFADLVWSLDPDHRMICNGNGPMRNSQYHQMHYQNWQVDSYNQYVEMMDLFTPSHMNGNSEHLYDHKDSQRIFSDKGAVSRPEQVRLAIQASAKTDNAYYIGEFSGASMVSEDKLKEIFSVYYNCGVQLYMTWNFAFAGNIEHSFTQQSGKLAFELIRQNNKKYGMK